MAHYNVSSWDLLAIAWSCAQFTFQYGSEFAQEQIGAPAGKFVSTARALYTFSIAILFAWWRIWEFSWMGGRSVWRILWGSAKWARRIWSTQQTSPLPTNVFATQQSTHPILTQPAPTQHPVPVGAKVPVADSTVSTPSESPHRRTRKDTASKDRVFCQAHLIRRNGRDGPMMECKARKGVRVKPMIFMAADTLTKNGLILTSDTHILEACVRGRHREA